MSTNIVISNLLFAMWGTSYTNLYYVINDDMYIDALFLTDKDITGAETCQKISEFPMDVYGYEIIIFLLKDEKQNYQFFILQANKDNIFKLLLKAKNVNINNQTLVNIFVCKHPVVKLKENDPMFMKRLRNLVRDFYQKRLNIDFLMKIQLVFHMPIST